MLRLLVDRLVILRREAEAQEFIARLGPGATLDPNTLLQMGINLYNDDKLAEALAHFDGLIQGNPSWPDAYYYRGRTLLGMSDFTRAKQDFEKVLELDPAHAFAEDCRSFIKSL